MSLSTLKRAVAMLHAAASCGSCVNNSVGAQRAYACRRDAQRIAARRDGMLPVSPSWALCFRSYVSRAGVACVVTNVVALVDGDTRSARGGGIIDVSCAVVPCFVTSHVLAAGGVVCLRASYVGSGDNLGGAHIGDAA